MSTSVTSVTPTPPTSRKRAVSTSVPETRRNRREQLRGVHVSQTKYGCPRPLRGPPHTKASSVHVCPQTRRNRNSTSPESSQIWVSTSVTRTPLTRIVPNMGVHVGYVGYIPQVVHVGYVGYADPPPRKRALSTSVPETRRNRRGQLRGGRRNRRGPNEKRRHVEKFTD